MKEIHILHLMPKLLSLYGEYGNVAILNKVLTDKGYSVIVDQWENGALDLTKYDFVYVGSGTEDNLCEATRRLSSHADAVRHSIDQGICWLATGNAMAVFGKSALGVLSYETETVTESRYMGDVLTQDLFGGPLVGYINTGCRYSGIVTPLFRLRFGLYLGNEKNGTDGEGILHNRFYGTQLIGPVLVKNPHFLAALASQITGEMVSVDSESYLCKAYDIALRELQKRASN